MNSETSPDTASKANESMNNTGSQTLSVSQRELDQTVIDIEHESGVSLLVQPGAGGYQLDTFWNGTANQANNWVRFTPDSSGTEIAYDNQHDRNITGEVRSEPNRVILTDPEPRGEPVGYEPAELNIQFIEDAGFRVKMTWVNNKGETRKSFAIAPVFDPREMENGEREQYYEVLEYNQSDLDPETTIETYTTDDADS